MNFRVTVISFSIGSSPQAGVPESTGSQRCQKAGEGPEVLDGERESASGASPTLRGKVEEEQGLNSIEFQQNVQQGFQQSTLHSVVLNALLKITLNSLLKFN